MPVLMRYNERDPHCEIYEVFKAWKNLGVGINYTDGAKVKAFPSSDLELPEADRKPFFSGNSKHSSGFIQEVKPIPKD
jgi:hypothetical protein